MTYQAYIVELKSIVPHPNADRLNIAHVFGSNVIVGKDLKVGDVVAYFPSDGQLSLEFAEFVGGLLRKRVNGVETAGYMDASKRNIKAIRLRGSQSDGLIIKIQKVADYTGLKLQDLKPGTSFQTLNGKEICRKYVPKHQKTLVDQDNVKKKANLKDKYPLFTEYTDTKHLAYNMEQFKQGDIVTISLKLHGTSHRISHTLVKEKVKLINRIKNLFISAQPKSKYEVISGTRKTILDDYDKKGFYGTNRFREFWDLFFEGKLHKGETVYGEIVGWYGEDENQTIMPSSDNKKLKDKEFVKTYGDKTTFSYGCNVGENDFYVYRMTMTNEDGQVVEYPTELAQIRCEQMGVKHVPVIDRFIVGDIPFNSPESLFHYFNTLSDGADLIDPRHIREGIIVRIENRETFTAYKHKGFSFKVLESIIKDFAEEPDMEEQGGVVS